MDNQFGKYSLLDKLGDGGMAEVFLAQMKGPEGFSKFVAIKRILPHLSHDTLFTESFINEARLGGYLSHHNIVQTLDFGQIDGFYYLTMEYVQGINLGQVMRFHQKMKDPLPVPLAVEIALQICEGLAYAHEATDTEGRALKMVHRDMKPTNILMNTHGVVKIADFGVARAETNVTQTVAGTGNPKGTVAYMSPEQALGEPQLDGRSDIFSLGAILYEMVMNERLYTSDTYLGALRQAQDCQVAERLAKMENHPNAALLLPVLTRVLSPRVDDRYPDSAAFRQDLRRTLMRLEPDISLGDYVRARMEELGSPTITRNASRNSALNIKPGQSAGGGMVRPAQMPAQPSSRSPAVMPPHPGPSSYEGASSRPAAAPYTPQEIAPTAMMNVGGGGMGAQVAAPTAILNVGGAEHAAQGVTRPITLHPGPPSHTGHPPATLPPSTSPALESQTLRKEAERHAASAHRFKSLAIAVAMVAVLIGVGMGIAWFMSAGSSHVIIAVDPADAELLLSNGTTAAVGNPFQVPDEGVSVRVEKPGYTAKQLNIPANVQDGQTITVKLDPLPTSLYVAVEPAGASLSVDGKEVEGSAPFTLEKITPDHTMKVVASLEGYKPEEMEISLAPGENRRLTLTLSRLTPEVEPNPRGGAKPPDEGNGVRGARGLTSARPVPINQPVAAAPQEVVAPQSAKGFLMCNAVPRGGGAMWAKVHVDGTYVGNTPLLKHPLAVGDHNIKLISQDGRTFNQSVTVREGETTRLIAEFD